MRRIPKLKVANPVLSEHAEQVAFVNWFRLTYPNVLIFANPNGGYRSKITAGRIKAEGGVAGIPDLFIPEWGLWIEMKRTKGGVLSDNQKAIIGELDRVGYDIIIGKGADETIEKIKNRPLREVQVKLLVEYSCDGQAPGNGYPC
jgi:hypothetical protein